MKILEWTTEETNYVDANRGRGFQLGFGSCVACNAKHFLLDQVSYTGYVGSAVQASLR